MASSQNSVSAALTTTVRLFARIGRDGGAWVVADAGGIATPRLSLVWFLRHLGAANGGLLEDPKYFLFSLLYFPPTPVRSVSDALLPRGFLCYAPFSVRRLLR